MNITTTTQRTLQFALAAAFAVVFFAGASYTPPAHASQSCTAKCAEEESICIKRTNNKGQCGDKAKQCTSKCK